MKEKTTKQKKKKETLRQKLREIAKYYREKYGVKKTKERYWVVTCKKKHDVFDNDWDWEAGRWTPTEEQLEGATYFMEKHPLCDQCGGKRFVKERIGEEWTEKVWENKLIKDLASEL